MAERVQIVLEAQDLASGVLRGLVSRFGSLGQVVSDASDAFGRFSNFMSLANDALTDSSISTADLEKSYADMGASMARLGETIAVLLVQTIQEAIKVTDEYNGKVRDLALVSGQGAEATSRFIQVLDDYELTADDAMTAAKALKEKGLSPTIDTLAMLSDEFKKIKDPAERMAFVQENLGKGGAKWVNVLNQSSDALRKAAASIDPWLVKTDEQIKKAEISRLALDELGDSWAAFQNRIGDAKNEMIFTNETHARAVEILENQGVKVTEVTKLTQEYRDAVEQAKVELLAGAEASLADTQAKEENAAALKALAEANAEIINNAITLTDETKNYQDSQQGILDKIGELEEKGKSLHDSDIEGWKAVQEEIDNLKIKYEEDAAAYIAAQEKKFAMDAVNKIEMEDGVAGFNEAERSKAQAILETTDVATAAAFEQAQAQSILTDAVANGRISVEEFGSILDSVMADGVVSVDEVTAAINAIPPSKDVSINVMTNYSSAGQAALEQQYVYGSGRASGGTVTGGGLYPVVEKGAPEMLNIDGRDYLMTPKGSNGSVTPMSSQGGSGNDDIIAALYATKIEPSDLARALTVALQQVNK